MVKNKNVNEKDMDKEIDEILKISNTEISSQNQDDNITLEFKQEENEEIYNDEEDVYVHVHNIQKRLKEIYNDIKENKIEGFKLNNQIYKIKDIDKEQQYLSSTHLFYFDYYLSMEDIKEQEKYIKLNYYYELLDRILIKKLPLLWKIKNFWYRNNPINLYKKYKVKKDYENDIKEMLYNGGCIKENPFKNKNEYKSSLTDKIKWFGYNLLHCHCSDKEEESCDIDIENIIKNNSYEGIKEYEKEKDELYKLQGQVRSILEIMDNKEYPLIEYKINEDRTYRPYYSDKWVKRLTELGYDSHLKEDLERFIKDGEKNIRKTLYEIDIKDRRQGRIGD